MGALAWRLGALVIVACVCACGPTAKQARAQRDDPAPPPTCQGHLAATDAPSGWRTYPVVAESGTPALVDVVDEGEGRLEVREVSLDRFFVRYALGATTSVGLMEIRERSCGEARIISRPEWNGGVLHLRRRVLEYVVTWTPSDAPSETPLAAFRWVPNAPKPR